jgi:hypothetical protein
VLLNADRNLSIVGTFQVELLEGFLQNKF